MAAGKFQLLDLSTEYAFEFQYFPEEIGIEDAANWEAQNTTIGVKPLFYGNGEPRRISVDNLYLDYSDTNVSVKPDLDLLKLMMTDFPEDGPPSPLLAIWGDYSERVVLTRLSAQQILFNPEGNCIRARVSLELLELQPDGEVTDVTILDNEDVQPG